MFLESLFLFNSYLITNKMNLTSLYAHLTKPLFPTKEHICPIDEITSDSKVVFKRLNDSLCCELP